VRLGKAMSALRPSDRLGEGPVQFVPSPVNEPEEVAPLPRPLTPLVGCEHAAASAAALLRVADLRLLILTGPGGVGKTRLALRVATDLAADFPAGVVFVALAAIADPSLVLPAIAEASGVRGEAGRPLLERLARALGGEPRLVVLDNVE
jgi:hypothetical protein